MLVKGLATFAVLLTVASAPMLLSAQATTPPPQLVHPTQQAHPAQQIHPSQAAVPAANPVAPSQARDDCNGIPCEDQQPRVIVVPPSPAPVQWLLHDRIAWAATLVLVLLGYIGVMLALSTLKKIERHTAAAEQTASAAATAATAAAETAQAALLHAQSIIHAERPWIVVTAKPARGMESSFEISATNRGRSPATITSAYGEILFAADEAHLPPVPEFEPVESASRFVPITLLPGESATLKTFSRDEVKSVCGSDEKFRSIEGWTEKIFLCGKVMYNDLIAPAGKGAHETNWCCWYIHGKQRSALVPAGPAEYNAHT